MDAFYNTTIIMVGGADSKRTAIPTLCGYCSINNDTFNCGTHDIHHNIRLRLLRIYKLMVINILKGCLIKTPNLSTTSSISCDIKHSILEIDTLYKNWKLNPRDTFERLCRLRACNTRIFKKNQTCTRCYSNYHPAYLNKMGMVICKQCAVMANTMYRSDMCGVCYCNGINTRATHMHSNRYYCNLCDIPPMDTILSFDCSKNTIHLIPNRLDNNLDKP